MITEFNDSKDAVKNRMLRHALNFWGIKNAEEIDPAIKLIFEALSSELYRLGNEVKDTQVRILEKIAHLMASDFLTSPNPAHAILHAAPVEPKELLSGTTSFFAQSKLSVKQDDSPDTPIEVFFTPVSPVQLFDIEITQLVSGGKLFGYNTSFLRQPGATARFVEPDVLWMGLKINPAIDSIGGLSLCFDWKNTEVAVAKEIYKLLPLTAWFLNERKLQTKQGLPPAARTEDTDSLFAEYDLLPVVENDITSYYTHKFIHIEHSALRRHDEKQLYPSSFSSMFAEADLLKLKENLLWIKIVFPSSKLSPFLNDVYIYPNSFPVMNRQINEVKHRMKGGSNIIPIKTEVLDQFLAVSSVSDDRSRYQAVPFRKMDEEETGTFTIRNGGVERFDNRNAREMINYVLELLRSESAAFAAYGYDFVALTMKELNQKISLMEQKAVGTQNTFSEISNYVIVKPKKDQDVMYVDYWTTMAEAANNIRAGSRMELARGVKVKSKSMILMTTTTGGKSRLKPEERLNAFRYGIMTRNRVVTTEDVKNFCFHEQGDRISKVEISKGFELSVHSREAFRRTIDVKITPWEDDALDETAWNQIAIQLKAKLQSRSGINNNYRIIIAHQQT